jgi:hypothetical protein
MTGLAMHDRVWEDERNDPGDCDQQPRGHGQLSRKEGPPT